MTETIATNLSLDEENSAVFENPRSRLQSPLLWLLTVALTIAPLHVLRMATPMQLQYGLPLVSLVAAWGILSTSYLKQLPGWERRTVAYRSAELVVIGTLLRLALWLGNGFPDQEAWLAILRAPLQLLGGGWPGYFLLSLFVWAWSVSLAHLFSELEVEPAEERFYSLPLSERRKLVQESPIRQQRTPLLRSWFARWILGGVILIFFAALSTTQIGELVERNWFTGITRLPLPPAVIVSLLLYFFVGLWLLSYARYTVLYARWLANGIQPRSGVARNWRRTSLLLLGGVGLLAAFLPIGSSLPIAWLVSAIIWLLSIITFAIMSLIGLLFAPFARGGTEIVPEVIPPDPVVPPQLPFDDAVASGPLLPPEVAGGITLFIGLAVVIVALLFLFRGRNYEVMVQSLRGFWQRLSLWLRGARASAELRVVEVREALAERFGRIPRATTSQGRVKRINEMTPREQIRYFYLSAVKRAQERGVERGNNETPGEFLEKLQEVWPDSAEDSAELTDAFNHARYSRKPVVDDDLSPIKQTWKRVRSSLRKRKTES